MLAARGRGSQPQVALALALAFAPFIQPSLLFMAGQKGRGLSSQCCREGFFKAATCEPLTPSIIAIIAIDLCIHGDLLTPAVLENPADFKHGKFSEPSVRQGRTRDGGN